MVRWSRAVPPNARRSSEVKSIEVNCSQSFFQSVFLLFVVSFCSLKVHLNSRSGWLYIQRAVQDFALATRAEDDAGYTGHWIDQIESTSLEEIKYDAAVYSVLVVKSKPYGQMLLLQMG